MKKLFNIVLLSIFALLLSWCFGWDNVYYLEWEDQTISSKVLKNIDTIEFMWEEIVIDDYNYLRKRLEREFHIVADTTYQYVLWLKRTWMYFPYIEYYLEQAWLPNDLKYLPIAESFLRNEAYSSAGAAGIWQFMTPTSRQYWLIVNDNVDERNNYQKATLAAIDYLQYLHNFFDWDWLLALAWYNKWENAIRRTVENQSSDDYFDLLLNTETWRFIPRIMAIKIAYEYREQLGMDLDEDEFYSFPDYEVIEVESIDNLFRFARENNTSLYDFYQLNPWIKVLNNNLPAREDWANWELKVSS